MGECEEYLLLSLHTYSFNTLLSAQIVNRDSSAEWASIMSITSYILL